MIPRVHHHLVVRSLLVVCALAACTAVAALLTASPAQAKRTMLLAADDQSTCLAGKNPSQFARASHANVVRIVIPTWTSNAAACAHLATASGYRVVISVQYDNRWRPARVASYFKRLLPAYAGSVWAVGVGNEQDLVQGGPAPHGRSRICSHGHCHRSTMGEDYRSVWNAVEPVIARVAPRALRVYGDSSPWGLKYIEDGFRSGRPRGASAIAFHCYDTTNLGGIRVVPELAAWAARRHLPLWCTEMSRINHPVASWMRRDSPGAWARLLSSVERRSPNLKMISFYRWPAIGAR